MRTLLLVTLAIIVAVVAFVMLYPTKFGHRYLVPASTAEAGPLLPGAA